MNQPMLKVAEHFYSIQGEGSTIGIPAVFVRLSGCVLQCKWCDTIEVWKTGKEYSFEEFRKLLLTYKQALLGGAHLIITGGDPLIQQEILVNFLPYALPVGFSLNIEVETEGMIKPSNDLCMWVDQFNVSPKLSNSGMKNAIRPDILTLHYQRPKDIFKFVVGNEADVYEVMELSYDMGMSRRRIYLMPQCATRAEQDQIGPVIAELAKEHGFNYSPRLHLQLWDKATGV